MSRLVNHGTEVRWRKASQGGVTHVWAEHEGKTGHESLLPGEQCECGILPVGVVEGEL